jgi:hypothetical protein
MNAYSIEDLRENLLLDRDRIGFAERRPYFYAQGTFDYRCRVGILKKKSHIYLHYKQDRRRKKNIFEIIKPGTNGEKYVIAEIDETSIDYNYNYKTAGCIISYTPKNSKKKCKVVLTPCDEKKRKTKYSTGSCPKPGKHFDKPIPHLTNWKNLLNLWILESPSRSAGKSKSKPTRKSQSTRKSSPSTRKSPSPSRTQYTRKTPSPSTRKSPSRRGGARNYHKATKKHRRKKIKKTRKNK